MLRHFLIFSLLTASLCSLAQELSFDVLTKREGLPSCSILDITEDKEGFMWVATEGQGLLSFDGVRFEPHPLATADSVFAVEEKGDSLLYLTREGLAVCHDDEISMLIELKNTPCTQFAVHENKLFLIRNDGALVQRSGDSLITLNDDDLHSGFVLSEGELFVLSDKGIAICDGKSNWMSLPDHDAPYSAIAKDKMLYVAGSDAVYLFENNQFTELPFTRDKHIKTIGIDVLGRLWMATRNSLMYEDANGLVEIGPKNGLPSGNISTIYTDRSGALWFGTAASGMFALRDMSVEQFTRTHGFPESRVTAIAIQGDSAGWIGTSDGQIFSIKRKKSLTPELIANVGTEIIDIHLCNSQVVFSTNNAVYRWQNNSIQKTSDLGGKLSGCPQSIILNNGIEFPGRKLSFSDLACDHLTDVISTDTLVFLTSSCGLFRIPLNQGKPDLPEEMTTFYPIEGSDLYEFTCAYVSKSGTYWFGTRHDGLLRYNGFNLEVVARKSLPDPSVTGICESTDGNIWISTPSGLCQVELNETGDLVMNIRSFSTTDEIVPGTLNAIHNRLVYGTPVGLRGFNPSGIFPDTYPLHVILSDVLVNFEPLREPQLAHDQNNLSFHFFAIDIADPYSVEYQCRLSGLESEYRTVTSPVIYSDLVPGDYVFEIRAKNHSGIWSVEPTKYAFTIHAPFYKQGWFLFLAALLLAATIIGGVRWRLIALKEQNRKLDRLVEHRTEELRMERDRSERLLLNILPKETAEELKTNGVAMTRSYRQATVLFSDFKGFTQTSELVSSAELVSLLDAAFKSFDRNCDAFGVEKIKTIGDAYMCATGLPQQTEKHASSMMDFAFRMLEEMVIFNAELAKRGLPPWEIRIGIHTGPLIAGVVGEKKFAYDIWGDTVNTASRMESSGEPGKINISSATYELIKNQYHCFYRGKVAAKNKGELEMYFVESKK